MYINLFIIIILLNLINIIKCFNIYVLELASNKYYIGKTIGSVESKLLLHQIGEGNDWTRTYIPKKIIEKIKCTANLDENIITTKYMFKYGINNVRGGSYSNFILNDFQIFYLENEIEKLKVEKLKN